MGSAVAPLRVRILAWLEAVMLCPNSNPSMRVGISAVEFYYFTNVLGVMLMAPLTCMNVLV